MSFDILAPHYRWMELVLAGNKLQRCRTAFLENVPPPKRILIPGEGNGRFLVECRRRFPQAEITIVEASGRMLERARSRLKRSGVEGGPVEFLQSDILRWSPKPDSFELVVTHFFLDCFDRELLKEVIAKLAAAAARDAAWLLADFAIPPTGWRSLRARLIHKWMYLFFRCVTALPARQLIVPAPFLKQHGFELKASRASDWGLLHSDLWVRAAA